MPCPISSPRLRLALSSSPTASSSRPMCQYSAQDGSATDWHLQHLMQLAISRAGMVVVEATAVERNGRISHGCLGLYSDANEAALARVLDPARRVAAPGTRFAIQIGACRAQGVLPAAVGGRQAAHSRPRTPGRRWRPRPFPSPRGPPPQALDAKGLARVTAAFCQAAERAVRLGFDAIELHGAHGYLLHAFVSPALQPAQGRLRRQRARTACASRSRWRARCAPWCRARGAGRAHHRHRLGRRRARCRTMRWRSPPRSRPPASTMCACRAAAPCPHVKIPLGPGLPGAVCRQGEGGNRARHARRRPDRHAGRRPRPSSPPARPTSSPWRAPSSTTRAGSGTPPSAWARRSPIPPPYARTSRAAWPGAAIVRPNCRGRSVVEIFGRILCGGS